MSMVQLKRLEGSRTHIQDIISKRDHRALPVDAPLLGYRHALADELVCQWYAASSDATSRQGTCSG